MDLTSQAIWTIDGGVYHDKISFEVYCFLTFLGCHVTEDLHWLPSFLRVDPVLSVFSRIARVPDVFAGMSRKMRVLSKFS